jgi:simple sugar transport system permease protein
MIARRPLPAWAEIAVLPLVNIALAFITGRHHRAHHRRRSAACAQLLVVGAIGSSESIGYTLYYTTNFIFTGLAVAVAFHAGLFNIGGEGRPISAAWAAGWRSWPSIATCRRL